MSDILVNCDTWGSTGRLRCLNSRQLVILNPLKVSGNKTVLRHNLAYKEIAPLIVVAKGPSRVQTHNINRECKIIWIIKDGP